MKSYRIYVRTHYTQYQERQLYIDKMLGILMFLCTVWFIAVNKHTIELIGMSIAFVIGAKLAVVAKNSELIADYFLESKHFKKYESRDSIDDMHYKEQQLIESCLRDPKYLQLRSLGSTSEYKSKLITYLENQLEVEYKDLIPKYIQHKNDNTTLKLRGEWLAVVLLRK